ncbi:MAG: c-type cytochrome [Nitrospinota bacterium]
MEPRMGAAKVKRFWGTSLASSAILAWTLSIPAPAPAAGDPGAGKAKYGQLCIFCHGASGKGDGPAARGFPVKPADHTNKARMNSLSDAYLAKVIKGGGSSVGKSPLMPPFGSQLSETDVQNLIAYIRSLAR